MILTGPEIRRAIGTGDIVIDPFEDERISPNAYDWRLGDVLLISDGHLDAAHPSDFIEQKLPPEGFELVPGNLYLGITHERTCSERYAQFINGDRTIGALGIWVHVSAPLGHVGHAIRWTLEICVARRVRVYPRMTFGKIVFLEVSGALSSYQNMGLKYTSSFGIDISRLYEEVQ